MWKGENNEKKLNAKLFVRILPSTDFSYDLIKTETNKKVLYVRCLQDLSKCAKVKNPNYWYFCTDGVFWNSCQNEVYETVTSGLYEELFDGVRAMVLCYGQVGTGKTFTASGLRFPFQMADLKLFSLNEGIELGISLMAGGLKAVWDPDQKGKIENRGLILRILSQLFEEEEARCDVSRIKLGMSYLEFTGQIIKDLISNKCLNSVRDVVEYPISDETMAWRQIFNAECRKSYTDSAAYKGSNRGHSVLTFYVHSESLIDTDSIIKHSKIHIVDMGGIDNLGNKPSERKNKLDVGNSNISKSLMEQFIMCMTKTTYKNESHICPYKSSRFLLYLHDTLNEASVLRFVAHIYGNPENLPITISTLRFGERIRALRPTKLERIYESNRELQIRNLEREYFRLKDEAELVGMLRDSPDSSNISQERLQEIKRAAEAFLFNQLEDLTLFSLGQASLTLKVFRDLYQKLSAEKDQIVKDAVCTAAEIMQTQMAADRFSICNVSMNPSTQKLSRRKSRQAESQFSFGVSHRSSDSIHNVGKVLSVVQQAGVTDKKGIGIGPGKTASSFEGNITKAVKKMRSKKSESVIMKGLKTANTKELGILSSKNQDAQELSELSVGTLVPSREAAWQCFFNERTEQVTELSDNVTVAEEKAKEAKRKYTMCLVELARIREEIEENKVELENCQHFRQICGKGDFDEYGNSLPGDFERSLTGLIQQKELLINAAIENCHVALTDFRTATEELNNVKRVLEDVFQEFCKEYYKTIFPPGDSIVAEIKSSEMGKGFLSELDLKNQARMELYSQLQKKLFNYVPKIPKNRRKEWIGLF